MEEKYDDFFNAMADFIEKRELQKLRGINDYNIVNVVRKENAEVGMHSNVIYSLINPNGLHYQKDLFLQLFIKYVLKIDDFGEIISVRAEELTNETRRIDFTIKSSNYYIGVEMKIDAHDLHEQISHYYEDLQTKAKENNNQKVIIYYLTKDGKEAHPDSRKEITYKQVSFEKHILNWIEKCQYQVRNITNLNEAFENYKDIVNKITKNHRSKVMSLREELEIKLENYKIALEIADVIPELKTKTVVKFFEETRNIVQNVLNDTWIVESKGSPNKPYYSPIVVKKENWSILLKIEFSTPLFIGGKLGVVRTENSPHMQEIYEIFKNDLEKTALKFNVSDWWLLEDKIKNSNELVEDILFNEEFTAEKYAKKILHYLNVLENDGSNLLSKINQYPKEK